MKSRHRPIIRLFVSSTFSDMKLERDALQRKVFPELEQFCLQNRFQFQAIDLRWGVSTEAGLDHRTMRICFEELRRAQEISPEPNFLILLGNRYGWRPLSEEISIDAFARLETAAKALDGVNSITPHIDTLKRWYQRDDNAVPPVHTLQPRRKPQPGDPDQADYRVGSVWAGVEKLLWSIINHEQAFPANQLGGRFDGFRPGDSIPGIVHLQTSATEQEIWHGALNVTEADKHVLAFFREIDLPTNTYGSGESEAKKYAAAIKDYFDMAGTEIDPGPQSALAELKKSLKDRLGTNAFDLTNTQKAVLTLPSLNDAQKATQLADANTPLCATLSGRHLDALCSEVKTRLKAIIDAQIKAYWNRKDLSDQPLDEQVTKELADRELEIEVGEHARFGMERGDKKLFIGRNDQQKKILAYLNDSSRLPLVVHGASGCGKTGLLARIVQEVSPAEELLTVDLAKGPIVRFIGITPRSSDLRSLLRSLCQQLRHRNPQSEALSSDIRELSQEFRRHLESASEQQPITLLIDALDQLAETDNGLRLYWIPFGSLPEHVKIAVSCLSDREANEVESLPFTVLQQRRLPSDHFVNLDALSIDDAANLLFKKWLPTVGRKITDKHEELIRSCLMPDECRQPLYLKLVFEEVRHWRATDVGKYLALPPEDAVATSESTRKRSSLFVAAILSQFFDRLSSDSHHGKLLVDRALGYIAAARRGLTENEILEVLFADRDLRQETLRKTIQNKHRMLRRPCRIPIALWSRLRSDLAPFLTERAAPGGSVVAFYHRQITEWVHKRFVEQANWPPHGDDPTESSPHARLARYFARQDYFLESLEEQRTRARRLPPTPRPSNIRKVDELPWQLLEVARQHGQGDPKSPHWDAIATLFTDIHFLESKAEAAE